VGDKMTLKTENDEKVSAFTCFRGPMNKMRIILKNKAEKEFFCKCSKEQFEIFFSNRTIEVYDKDNINNCSKYLKSFLTFINQIGD
jgi:hypothetical protein